MEDGICKAVWGDIISIGPTRKPKEDRYADDTVFICSSKLENIKLIKYILRNFEILSGLKVNFNKCCLMGLNIKANSLRCMASLIRCEVGQRPFSYLGLSIGINHRQTSSWTKLVDRIRRRLAKWDDKNMSLGGRVTLIHSVLSAIPIYYLSFYHTPKKTIKEIISLQRNFLWGGCEDNNKIPWVSWEDICKDKGKGGLGIQDLGRFNLVLLSKWVWRFLTEPGRLWARIIRSKYGGLEMVLRERPRVSGQRRSGVSGSSFSGWWRDICEVYKGSEGRGVFKDFIRVVGNGNDTSFWSDTWVDEVPLKSKFNRLYRVSEKRESKVCEMGSWDDSGWN
ncbi:hypothetical protein ACS0TY_027303 [Phlomoides rotata]